ncbi:MAG: hypothetical protein ACRDJF_07475 [Actinomycetota bacterium]
MSMELEQLPGMSLEELEAEYLEVLPHRDTMSLINIPITVAIGAIGVAALNNLNVPILSKQGDVDQDTKIDQRSNDVVVCNPGGSISHNKSTCDD